MVRGCVSTSGDVQNQPNSKILKRVLVTVSCVLFILALVGVPSYFFYISNQSVLYHCQEGLSVPLLNPKFHSNGSVEDGDDLYPSGYHVTTNGTTRACPCLLKPCIRKCCGKDEYLVKTPYTRSRCETNPGSSPFDNFSLPVHESSGKVVKVDKTHFRIVYGDVCFHGKFVLDSVKHPSDKYDLMIDGRLQHISGDHLEVSRYCLDSMNGSEEIRTFVCFQDPNGDDHTKFQRLVYPILMMVSIPFLLATIIVYLFIPGLRNLHGKSIVCQCSSLVVSYSGLAVMQLKGNEIHIFSCIFLAFLVQFAFLASFFWLNVMSFDIWWLFSGLRPPQWGLKSMEQKKFLLYSLYAWGMPLTITVVSLVVHFTPSIPESFIKPNFGEQSCWFADWYGELLYFYLPSGIVLGMNIVMFVTTAIKLRCQQQNDHDKPRFHLYLSLFILMGLNWTLELLSFLVGGPKFIWFVTDISNSLQGVVLFFFLVCKREILKKLNKKFCPSWNICLGPSQELSESLSTSDSLTKAEVDIVALMPHDDHNESHNVVTQPHVT